MTSVLLSHTYRFPLLSDCVFPYSSLLYSEWQKSVSQTTNAGH